MRNIELVLAFVICLGAHGILSASNVSDHMEDYIRQNQRQYDAKLKQLEDELATFREIYTRELRVINVQATQLQVKLDEAAAHLNPLELIDSWHKQCVQNYSASIPLISTVRSALLSCSSSAQSALNGFLTSPQNTYNSLKSFYNNNFKTLIANCEKQNPTSQQNYTICITTAIATTNSYTVNNQKNFNTYMQSARCSADTRITTAWECAFTTVHSTSSTLGTAIRLIDDCISNKVACAFVTCNNGCNKQMLLNFKENDFLNATINNPFFGLNSKTNCMEIKFKH